MAQANIHTIKASKIELKKSLGQNFLTDVNIVRKIVNTANVDKDTSVIEIGPGIGALTEILLEDANDVTAVEIDQRLIPILEQTFAEQNFQVVNIDFLKTTATELEELVQKDKVKVVANLPYYITTAIITKILLEMPFIDELYIMVQKEVAERIAADAKTKKYNSLSVFCQTISDVKYEFTVKKTVFDPVPKIDSAIISFKRKAIDVDIAAFEIFVQNAFKQKRKTIVNNLNAAYGISKEDLIVFLEANNYKKTLRSEEITVEEFKVFYEKFIEKFEK